jgi:hypothetical protein
MIKTNQHHRLDEEARILEDIETGLLEDIRYMWHRTREMAGHNGWVDMVDPETGEMFCTGCDCNHWNRIQLQYLIKKLRLFRKGVYQAY